MPNTMQSLALQLAAHPKQLFLIDGTGAVLTALLTAGPLGRYHAWFGMPQQTGYSLALIAALLAVYSFGCYFFCAQQLGLLQSGQSMTADFLYCLLTIILVGYHYAIVRWPAFLYFYWSRL
jgi:hypothetical protein